MVAEGTWRPARVEVDLAAIRTNVERLRAAVAPAAVCAVVKANGYSHGAILAAKAALEGGAAGLAVALVDEGVELRGAGITAPILILSEPVPEAFEVCFAEALTPTVATAEGVAAAERAAEAIGGRQPVHLKVNTGMHRVGVSVEEAPALAARLARHPVLVFEGCYTHFAVADGASAEDRAFTALQLERFEASLSAMAALGVAPVLRHAANTAGALAHPAARYDLVRCGIGVYGVQPTEFVAQRYEATGLPPLIPALHLTAQVTAVHHLAAGERPSYGRLRPLPEAATVATVPLGYADGLPRAMLRAGVEVLIGGKRRPLAGMVTMDQLVVDCGGAEVAVGDDVVLLGTQGAESIDVYEWASKLDTIPYEVLCALGARIPRRAR